MWLQNLFRMLVGAGSRPKPHQCVRQFFGTILAAERLLWAVALTAMVLDIHLTITALQLGLREMNPFARQLLDVAGLIGLYGLKSGALLVAVSLRSLVPDRYGATVPLALAIPSLLAVGINSSILLWVLL